MSVALRGNLKDFGIAEVFQLIGQQRKTGILEFTGHGQRVELCFDRGAVVSAAPAGGRPHAALGEMLVRCGVLTRERVEQIHRECEASAQTFPRAAVDRGWLPEADLSQIDDLLTRETIFAVMRWTGGSFDFLAQAVEHERPLETLLGAEQILMDGLRMVDEWQSFAEQVPSESIVFRRVERFDAYRQNAQEKMRRRLDLAERVFFLIDGRLAVRRIVDLSRLGTFDATRILADLRRAGVIEALDATEARRLRRSERAAGIDRARVRGWIALLFPLSLLLLVTAAAFREAPPSRAPAGLPVRSDPLEAARESFAVRRLRHALATYRLSEGRWPVSLAQLGERGLIDASALAAPPGRPYYYAHRDEGGVLLLAPPR